MPFLYIAMLPWLAWHITLEALACAAPVWYAISMLDGSSKPATISSTLTEQEDAFSKGWLTVAAKSGWLA